MRRGVVQVGAIVVVAGCLAGCGGGGGGAVKATSTPPGEPAVTTSAPPTLQPTPTTSKLPTSEVTVQSDETFTMPKVTGMVLQKAQDLLQSRGSYLMDQEDATGQHRIQVLDSNWKVCTQIPKAGRTVPLSTIVRLAAVKLDETCP